MAEALNPCLDCGDDIDNNGGLACTCSKCYGQLRAIGSAADNLSMALTLYLTRIPGDNANDLWIRLTVAGNAYRKARGWPWT